jgi:cytochrome c2
VAVVATALTIVACGASHTTVVPGTSPQRGKQLIEQLGCGACHTIGGIATANGQVGPPLVGLADRRQIAGQLANTPQNVAFWIQHPRNVLPQTVMPALVHNERDALDIVAYLYSQ